MRHNHGTSQTSSFFQPGICAHQEQIFKDQQIKNATLRQVAFLSPKLTKIKSQTPPLWHSDCATVPAACIEMPRGTKGGGIDFYRQGTKDNQQPDFTKMLSVFGLRTTIQPPPSSGCTRPVPDFLFFYPF